MEIHDEIQIEIFHTLEKITRMNNAIAFHTEQEAPSLMSIEQYQSLKLQMTNQLLELLAKVDVKLQVAA
jgi:hypothetical protein